MIELVANILVTVTSALLFSYWFCCACLLIRNENAALDFGIFAKRGPPLTGQEQASNAPAQEPVLTKNLS